MQLPRGECCNLTESRQRRAKAAVDIWVEALEAAVPGARQGVHMQWAVS